MSEQIEQLATSEVQAAPPVIEPPAQTESEVEKPAQPEQQEYDPKIAKGLRYLAKREQQLREEKAQLESERQRLAGFKKYEELETRIKSKDWSALKDIGFDYNDYTKYLLNDEKDTPETLIEKRARELEAKLEQKFSEKEREQQERLAKQYEDHQATLRTSFVRELDTFLESDRSSEQPKYELLSQEKDAPELLYNIIQEHYDKTQKQGSAKIMSKDQAAEIAEKYLEKQLEKYLSLNKIKSRFSNPAPAQSVKPSTSMSTQTPRTLTNQGLTAPSEPKRIRSLEDSLEEAKKLLVWK